MGLLLLCATTSAALVNDICEFAYSWLSQLSQFRGFSWNRSSRPNFAWVSVRVSDAFKGESTGWCPSPFLYSTC